MSQSYINIPPFYDRPKQVGELWTLQKDGRRATCHLWTHPIGGEVRLTVNGELLRSEAKHDGMALVDLGLQWKAQFEKKGWGVLPGVSGVCLNKWTTMRHGGTGDAED